MNWTRYELTILLCAAVVALGLSCTIAEFNYRVRPETPLRAFKLEDQGQNIYQVDFLGESISFALPPDWVRQFADSKQFRIYHEQVTVIMDRVSRGVRNSLLEAQKRLNEGKKWLGENKLQRGG